ncbi:hypothetical protein [Streptomyces anandii]|uniref:hypothetical protein n=1 Tax=Streptomyces anandii TaxID=285454 RepID=UPI00167A3040|nr:hypothetical protein [Streptomyces anandii]GGX78480.1 hypothetical protein GCM10010510_24290 [Streptomyces anandii JCM 4720]
MAGLGMSVALAGGLTVGLLPAAATAAPARADSTVARPAAASGNAVAAGSCAITRWANKGYYKCGTRVLDVDWDKNGTTDETFVVAANRTIWHTWRAADGWKEMPGHGRADNTGGWARIANWRAVTVWAGSTSYCNTFKSGKWHSWKRKCG